MSRLINTNYPVSITKEEAIDRIHRILNGAYTKEMIENRLEKKGGDVAATLFDLRTSHVSAFILADRISYMPISDIFPLKFAQLKEEALLNGNTQVLQPSMSTISKHTDSQASQSSTSQQQTTDPRIEEIRRSLALRNVNQQELSDTFIQLTLHQLSFNIQETVSRLASQFQQNRNDAIIANPLAPLRLSEELNPNAQQNAIEQVNLTQDELIAKQLQDEEKHLLAEQIKREKEDQRIAEQLSKEEQAAPRKSDLEVAIDILKDERQQLDMERHRLAMADEQYARRLQREAKEEEDRAEAARIEAERIEAARLRMLRDSRLFNPSCPSNVYTMFEMVDHFLQQLHNMPLYKIDRIERISSASLETKFETMWELMKVRYHNSNGYGAPLKLSQPTFAFYGGTNKNFAAIKRNGIAARNRISYYFDEDEGYELNTQKYGKGIYLTPDPSVAKAQSDDNRIIVCAVLRGKAYNCPGDYSSTNGSAEFGYDSHVSSCGMHWVFFNAEQVLPLFVLHLGNYRTNDTSAFTYGLPVVLPQV